MTSVQRAAKAIWSFDRKRNGTLKLRIAAGLAVILGNPKAVLFYMGMLPGFFDLSALTAGDIVAICAISFAVPLAGNLVLAASIHRARALLTSPRALRRTNRAAGAMLVGVGLLIPLL